MSADSVATTKSILDKYCPNHQYDTKEVTVFELMPEEHGTFDLVYSWGVLHHTGSMYKAIINASKMMTDDGLFILALYRKTVTFPKP